MNTDVDLPRWMKPVEALTLAKGPDDDLPTVQNIRGSFGALAEAIIDEEHRLKVGNGAPLYLLQLVYTRLNLSVVMVRIKLKDVLAKGEERIYILRPEREQFLREQTMVRAYAHGRDPWTDVHILQREMDDGKKRQRQWLADFNQTREQNGLPPIVEYMCINGRDVPYDPEEYQCFLESTQGDESFAQRMEEQANLELNFFPELDVPHEVLDDNGEWPQA